MRRNKQTELIRDGETLLSARRNDLYDIPVYDDGFGQLYIHRDSMGISGIVRAQSWEDAYSICEDEFFPEANETIEEIVREYGDDWRENELFCESFGFRPNGPNDRDVLNHGIYSKDLNGDSLDVLTQEMLDDLCIVLTVECDEDEVAK